MEINPETPQNEPSPSTSETKIVTKNPWWVKLCPHIIIISEFLQIYSRGVGFGSIFVIGLWIWLGIEIKRSKIMMSYFSRMCLLFIVVLNIKEIYPIVIDICKQILTHF